MGRTKGAKNKNSGEVPIYSTLPIEERIFVLANLIVDRIIEDQTNGKELLKRIGGDHETRTSATT
jgi:hypothetical protein